MNLLGSNTIRKRGCFDCADSVVIKEDCWPYFEGQFFCKHDKCSYSELDKFVTYEAYLRVYEKYAPWMF